MNGKNLVLTLATITTGLSAGLLFGYEVSVIPAFVTLSDMQYIASMQAINIAIQNPVFLLTYFSPALLLPLAIFMQRGAPGSLQFKVLIAATIIYIVGTLGITVGVNVPLNDTLAAFSLHSATAQQAAAARAAFEGPWNLWHTIRTLASIAAFVLAILACLSPSAVRSRQPKQPQYSPTNGQPQYSPYSPANGQPQYWPVRGQTQYSLTPSVAYRAPHMRR